MARHTPSALYKFGPFALDGEAAMLFRGGEPALLGRRAVALLRVLLDRAGSPVSKDALIEAAWPALAVEDSNLTVQIAALRRALEQEGGAGWIETLPRRGYRYVGPPVTRSETSASETTLPKRPIPETPSIAVLPFEQSGDASWFADGMADDISTGLSRIKWLVVIARNSSFLYRGVAVDAKQVGRDLGVRYVLQGSARRNDNRVRITVQLADSATGVQIWAERYDRTLEDVFALQDEIALAVVGAIEPNLRKAEVERVRRKRPESLDAYELVLRAQPDVDSGMPDRAEIALPLLMRALTFEPAYALAHGLAAMAHHNLFLRAGLKEEHRLESVRHARLALEHGRDDALALTFAGFSLGMDAHDRAAAFAAFETALTLSPSTALGFILGSVVHSWAGAAELAIAWGERGLRLSPFDPWAFAAFGSQAIGHFLQSRWEQAAKAAYQAVQSNPAHSINYVILIGPLVALGRLDEAKTAAARVLELQPTFRVSRQFAGVGCEAALASKLGVELMAAGLPE
ncbi:winged helix-turn-helix domain-containing tetratricopeptide repeat protein [Bradyrhizobium canariense]|uniref:winged helix-turn-helix domain-containing tetratricopeptide repeat protein n=2 Tax=Bradyrhizobium canariense TaxID=255045 RepID=UPI000A194EC7|nr:winged helix-turn-helix domain-containing tetratricopeptide repeat protein [Bradyrhizobium canariense]OSI23410.1 transcriptional regulator [Bradyrhizobium canariense]OSI33049.1 transcriptional regulator [Bradyrhizobium canariense]OSI41209.1 transcriptional regulator [Bradyrhizobium canariense]OSI46364.1 transcriptional regulator [Bradyrhizobium canariense]OSI51174.1 transcriptional regulator [Bradyrhizobium canariense]